MHVQVLQGKGEVLEKYISDFITEKKIPSYLVTSFDPLKIADVRILQKTLASKLPSSTFRLIIISNPTTEAQNALLKTLEELDFQSFVFFKTFQKEDLLSTILSRAKVVTFKNTALFTQEETLQKIVNAPLHERKRKILEFFGSIGDSITEENITDIQLSLRSLMLKERQIENMSHYFLLLKSLTKNALWLNSYNVQKRILLENLFLEVSECF